MWIVTEAYHSNGINIGRFSFTKNNYVNSDAILHLYNVDTNEERTMSLKELQQSSIRESLMGYYGFNRLYYIITKEDYKIATSLEYIDNRSLEYGVIKPSDTYCGISFYGNDYIFAYFTTNTEMCTMMSYIRNHINNKKVIVIENDTMRVRTRGERGYFEYTFKIIDGSYISKLLLLRG